MLFHNSKGQRVPGDWVEGGSVCLTGRWKEAEWGGRQLLASQLLWGCCSQAISHLLSAGPGSPCKPLCLEVPAKRSLQGCSSCPLDNIMSKLLQLHQSSVSRSEKKKKRVARVFYRPCCEMCLDLKIETSPIKCRGRVRSWITEEIMYSHKVSDKVYILSS